MQAFAALPGIVVSWARLCVSGPGVGFVVHMQYSQDRFNEVLARNSTLPAMVARVMRYERDMAHISVHRAYLEVRFGGILQRVWASNDVLVTLPWHGRAV